MDILHGVITSMLTPFTPSLQVDEETLASEIEYQIDDRINQKDMAKISFLKLFKKYISKKIRTFYK